MLLGSDSVASNRWIVCMVERWLGKTVIIITVNEKAHTLSLYLSLPQDRRESMIQCVAASSLPWVPHPSVVFFFFLIPHPSVVRIDRIP